MIVSNASVQKNGCSGFAWVIAAGLTPLWQGFGLEPGKADGIHSSRAEAFGLLMATIFIRPITRPSRVTQLSNASATIVGLSPT